MANQEVVIDGEVSLNLQMDGTPEKVVKVIDFVYPIYDGVTEITPTAEAQVLPTADRTTVTDIIINPIPSNYGLITWNGATLTVS